MRTRVRRSRWICGSRYIQRYAEYNRQHGTHHGVRIILILLMAHTYRRWIFFLGGAMALDSTQELSKWRCRVQVSILHTR